MNSLARLDFPCGKSIQVMIAEFDLMSIDDCIVDLWGSFWGSLCGISTASLPRIYECSIGIALVYYCIMPTADSTGK
jgi:hypothetical protein